MPTGISVALTHRCLACGWAHGRFIFTFGGLTLQCVDSPDKVPSIERDSSRPGCRPPARFVLTRLNIAAAASLHVTGGEPPPGKQFGTMDEAQRDLTVPTHVEVGAGTSGLEISWDDDSRRDSYDIGLLFVGSLIAMSATLAVEWLKPMFS